MKRFAVLLPLLLSVVACNPGASSGDPAEIMARAAEFNAAFEAGDADRIVDLYTADARMLAPNQPMTVGSDKLRAAFNGMLEAGLSVELRSIDAATAGDIGHHVGSYAVTAGGQVIDVGKFVETWQRGDDGAWRISNDIYNSDNPPPGDRNEHIMIVHEVNDARHWLAAWRGENSRHQLFRENGAAHVHTFRSVDDPHLTGLVISVTDMAALQEMLESEEGVAAAEADGVRRNTLRVLTEAE